MNYEEIFVGYEYLCLLFKGKYELDLKINKIGLENCHISIITQAELQFGVENSAEIRKAQNQSF
ncbi:MAG: type II toxin-antitoxin system VapC family toxin [Microscillaceae bacterium]|nr:type II toxin-antitoxin system VapC family toxin [Microscillaceae bacterium]